MAGDRLMAGRRILFAVGERADCLKQDLQDFGGIFGIAGERLMVGRRVFFAAEGKADCLKQDLQDFGGFSGFLRSVDVWSADPFCGGGKGGLQRDSELGCYRCLKQDFQDGRRWVDVRQKRIICGRLTPNRHISDSRHLVRRAGCAPGGDGGSAACSYRDEKVPAARTARTFFCQQREN